MVDVLDHEARELFSAMPAGRVFINAAYMSPKPRAALEAMKAVIDRYASPDFGAEEFFQPAERVRALLAELVGGNSSQYSLTGSVSAGTATLAWNLRARAPELVGDRREILGVAGQFPSNVQTWEKLAEFGFRFRLVEGGAGASERLVSAIGEQTALVAMEPLSWTDGRRIDFAAVCTAARQAGALSIADVTQCAGVDDPIDDALPCDVVVGAGYKWLLGPYGTGFMRLTPELQDRLEPLEWNWKNFGGSSDFNRLTEYRGDYASLAAKFDHGESSAFVRLVGWERGLRTLRELSPRRIRTHTQMFARILRESLNPRSFAVSDAEDPRQAAHLFRVEPTDEARFDPLSAALTTAGVAVSRRAGGWRISPHVYNGRSDLEALVAVLD
jgi:selenocysteine lyase/cysteine desulfurase